jgi:hypothetical protein
MEEKVSSQGTIFALFIHKVAPTLNGTIFELVHNIIIVIIVIRINPTNLTYAITFLKHWLLCTLHGSTSDK